MLNGHDPREIDEYAYRDLEVMVIVADEKGTVPDDLG
jgi:hypothetical protein